jgi:uncharacterized protein DUF3987
MGFTAQTFTPPPAGNGKANGHDPDPWPIINPAAYHGIAGDVVAALSPHTESDPIALLVQFLVSTGNAIGRGPYYLVEADRHFPNLFAVLAGESAKSRKGTSAGRVRRILEIADPDWTHGRTLGGMSSGEGVIHAVRDPLFGMRKGVEECIDPGVGDKRLLLDEREFYQALAVMRREGNILSRVVRDAWDCKHVLATLTKHSPTRATDALISIIGHITIFELQQTLDQTSMANGYANRFLFACVRRSKLLPHGGGDAEQTAELLGAKTLHALDVARALGRVTMTEAATRRWEEIYAQLSKGAPGMLGTIIARAEAQTLRLALLYALLDGATQIDCVHLEAALALWSYCEASARLIFGDLIGDPIADGILRALRTAGSNGMSRSEIHDLFCRNYPAHRLIEALAVLAAAGRIRSDHQPPGLRGGRPREMWFLS